MQASSGNLKRVQLELGGKGANIVFDDANLEAAVSGSAFAIFTTKDKRVSRVHGCCCKRVSPTTSRIGFLSSPLPFDLGIHSTPSTEMGPLTSLEHRERVLNYGKIATQEGGEILLGGKPPLADALKA